MKVCSFLPAATQTIYDLNFQNNLVGITFECPAIALKEKQILVRCTIDVNTLSSIEINNIFSDSLKNGNHLYDLDLELLNYISPDYIITQDTCDICLIDTGFVRGNIANLTKQPTLVSISPNSLKDVLNLIITIGNIFNENEKAQLFLQQQYERIKYIEAVKKLNKLQPKHILLLEWLDPFFNCGHWIPEQIEIAGGIDLLSNSGKNSFAISFEDILNYDPEFIMIAPCGFDIKRTKDAMNNCIQKHPFYKLKAFKNNQIYIADFDLFTQSSPSTIVSGIELLASILNPKFFDFKINHFKINT